MKHFVFHLISVILLIVLFLITLDLTRANQISKKEIDELTEKYTAAEQTLEKERLDASAKIAQTEKKAALAELGLELQIGMCVDAELEGDAKVAWVAL